MEALDQRHGVRSGAGLRPTCAGHRFDSQLAAAMPHSQREGRPCGEQQTDEAERTAPARWLRAGGLRGPPRPGEETPHHAEVERQVQSHEQHGAVAEEVVPVEHRQLLVGDPEDAQPRRREHIGHEQHAAHHVEHVA